MSQKAEELSSFKLEKLPSVVLGRILKMLPKADYETLALVCKSWGKLLHSLSLRYRRRDKQQRMEFLKKRIYESGSLEPFFLAWERRFVMYHKTILSPAFLQHHTVENYNVRTIKMADVKISQEDLVELFVRCPRVCSLVLHAINLNEDVCRAIGENLKELRFLRLSWSTNIGVGINLIIQGCRKLETVRLKSETESPCFTFGDLPESIRSLNVTMLPVIASDEDLKTLVERCPNIEDLKLRIIDSSFTEMSIDILCSLKNLKKLILRFPDLSFPALDFGRLREIGSLEYFRLKNAMISCEEFARIHASLPGVNFVCPVKKIALAENQNNSVGTSPDPVEVITIESSHDSSGTDFSDGEQRPQSSSPSRTQASSSGVEVARRGKKRRRFNRKKSLNRPVPNLRNIKQEQDFATVGTAGGPSAICKTEKMEAMDQHGSEQQVDIENDKIKLEQFPRRIKQEQDIEVVETAAGQSEDCKMESR